MKKNIYNIYNFIGDPLRVREGATQWIIGHVASLDMLVDWSSPLNLPMDKFKYHLTPRHMDTLVMVITNGFNCNFYPIGWYEWK